MVADHTWLHYEKEVVFCYFCQKSKTNSFASAKGCTNFRTSTLHRHKDCKEYEDAVNEEAMRDTFNNTQHHVFRAQSQVILTAMRAVYWLAKEDVATVKYNSLLNLLDEVGLKQIFKWEEMLQNNLIKVLKVCEMLLLLF